MENKLDPEFKAKWVAALRSGEYPQGKGCLKNEDGYCCLGVAYKVATGLEPDGRTQISRGIKHIRKVPKILIWGDKMTKEKQDFLNGLGEMNDGGYEEGAKSFSEIADYIEANL